MKPRFFKSQAEFRAWLEKNHETKDELYIGFYKVSASKRGIRYKEAVEESLCFGWIDGRVNRIDDERHMQRYTPRRKGSIWSAINIKWAKELIKTGQMTPAGLKAFEARDEKRSGYSYEQLRVMKLDAATIKRFKANKKAWAFYESTSDAYKRMVNHWVMSAKKPETRTRRLDRLIESSAKGERLN